MTPEERAKKICRACRIEPVLSSGPRPAVEHDCGAIADAIRVAEGAARGDVHAYYAAQRQQYIDILNEKLRSMGYKPGELQARWRSGEHLPFPKEWMELDAAILDALVNEGGATAWFGDGSSCAAQILAAVLKQRDEAEQRGAEKEREACAASLIRRIAELETRMIQVYPLDRPAAEDEVRVLEGVLAEIRARGARKGEP